MEDLMAETGIGPQKQVSSETKFYIRFEQTHHTTSAASVLQEFYRDLAKGAITDTSDP